ncbi:MAG TPA: penicillin acylase family protein [Candidatus Hydrogenedens sp.]|nr:penicillin acylase family protein [Candidatus Hydrogenedens sp.]
MKKVIKYSIIGILLFLLIACLLIGGFLFFHLYSAVNYMKAYSPKTSGTIQLSGVHSEVVIKRDDNGVPHIVAGSEEDAWFALGYVMAQDRLFQMDFYRRLSQGRISELVGPLAVKYDKVLRTFRLRKYAEEVLEKYADIYKPLQKPFDSFLKGINTFIENEPLPPEFRILGYQPEPFTAVDCLTTAMIMPITFADGLRHDLMNLVLKMKYPDEDFSILSCGYHREKPVTIMETIEEAEEYLKSQGRDLSNWGLPSASLQPPVKRETIACLEEFTSTWQDIVEFMGIHLGSNSWVLSGTRTQSGKPILANDPHIGFLQPSVWYQAHLVYENYDLYGFYFPLIPIPLMGQNLTYAWGLTMFANDDHDLYLEIFKPDDPGKVKYRGDWVPVIEETETIQVRFGKPVTFKRRVTPHGVVVTDVYRTLLNYYGPELSLYWVWQHVPYTDLMAFYKMSHAQDLNSFQEGVSLITSPGINVSYVDKIGNIAWWAGAKIPIRPEHVNSKYVLDGASGKDEVLGYVPFEQNPHLINPPWGYIVTANNLSTVKPVGEVKELQGYWEPSDRAQRMEELLEKRSDWTIDELKEVQLDHTSVPGPAIVKTMVELLTPKKGDMSTLEQEAFEKLSTWDYQFDTESLGASIFTVFCDAILRNLLIDDLGKEMLRGYNTVADRWSFFKYVIHDDACFLWDDRSTPQTETRSDIFFRAFKETVKVLNKKAGKNISGWKWGRIHTLEFHHPLGYIPFLRKLFNVGPFPCAGSYHVVNNMPYIAGTYKYEVVAGPSTRRLIDFAKPDFVLEVLPTGNSGISNSRWYRNQAELFIRGNYREARITTEQIDANTVDKLVIKPK